MPPRTPGEPGEEHGAEDPDRSDEVGFRPPLPPEDRIWRHPSEVARDRAPVPTPESRPAGAVSGLATRTAALAVVSGMIGATLAVAAVAALGGFDGKVVERPVAAQSVTSASFPADSRGNSTDDSPREDTATVAARTAPMVAAIQTWTDAGEGDPASRGGPVDPGQGSAVVLRHDGYLLTSAALLDSADRISVHLSDGTTAPARVVGVDPSTDVAVLHIDRDDLVEPAVASLDDVVVGAPTIAVGALADAGGDHAVSTGVVSALGRRLQAPDGTILHGMILVDAPFAPGTTGGALVDAEGRVLGITSALPATGAGDDRFGVATPIDVAHHIAIQFIEHGRARHGWMGIQGTDLGVEQATELGVTGAVHVEGVIDGGPAQRAGLLPGDVIVAVDEEQVWSMSGLIGVLQLRSAGDEIALEVWRGGDRLVVRCPLDDRPEDG